MIRLITTDLDGTLIDQTKREVSPRMGEIIHELTGRGIAFAPASGRQLTSLRRLFHMAADECYYVAENGAVVWDGQSRVIHKTPMDREVAEAAAWDFWNNSDGQGEVMISGECMSYLMLRGEDSPMYARMKFIGNRHTIIHDPAEIPEDIVKVACYFKDGSAHFIDRFEEKWAHVNCAISGPYWIDMMKANKGTGILALCEHLGIEPSQVMSFGDNFNDVPMLDLVGEPYLVEHANPGLLERYPKHVTSVEDALEAFLKDPKLS